MDLQVGYKMSFNRICRIIKRPTEHYYLQEKIKYQKQKPDIYKDEVGNIIRKDAVGNVSETWQDVMELEGVIQHRQGLKVDNQGEESKLRYYGYFKPNFNLITDKLTNYRVKFVRDYETLYLKIIKYDPNNFLRHKQHHIVLIMQEDLKYEGRQE